MVWIVLTVIVALAFVAFWLCGGRECIGDWLDKLFPDAPFQKGDKAHIFLNGKYNRTATVSGVSENRIFLYDNKLSLPIDYRGKFYAVGGDVKDGSRLVYVGHSKHFRFVRVAELIRKVFNVMDNFENLVVDGASQVETEETQETTEETTEEENENEM